MVGFLPKAFNTILPALIVPPQKPQFIYAKSCSDEHVLFGAISIASFVSVIDELLMVYE